MPGNIFGIRNAHHINQVLPKTEDNPKKRLACVSVTNTPVALKQKTSKGLINKKQFIKNIKWLLTTPAKKKAIKQQQAQQQINHYYQELDGIENKEYSFDFNQGPALLHKLKDIIPEIAEVLMTNGDKKNAENFLQGLCLGLSARYLMEERVHGPGGGRKYMLMLEYIADQYSKTVSRKDASINAVKNQLLNRYYRQLLGPMLKDVLSLHFSQCLPLNSDAAKKAYIDQLNKSGLFSNHKINHSTKDFCIDSYQSFMDRLRQINKNTFIHFGSPNHAMVISIHKKNKEDPGIWSFYDPNKGTKAVNTYKDFRDFMDNLHEVWPAFGYNFTQPSQDYLVYYNEFFEGEFDEKEIIDANSWKVAWHNESSYLFRALKEQNISFKLEKEMTGKVTDYTLTKDDNGFEQIQSVTFQLTDKENKQTSITFPGITNFDQAINQLKGYATDGETFFRTLKEQQTLVAFKTVTAKVIDYVLRADDKDKIQSVTFEINDKKGNKINTVINVTYPNQNTFEQVKGNLLANVNKIIENSGNDSNIIETSDWFSQL
ncbi:RTX toxin [Candidatus Hamiltonella defensa]|uniref:RTX toxin n=1 Tax=Candidatus Williamhamiltonella defendens TaxID=138072 RepID=A0AAC9VJV7_9ENTR|nr:RTX toxin [Candidatus Hamiltonella defensa]ASV33427.1 RTX toxin [Candidatus Hamiltonella defensa]AWK16372.1 RTX toxin [Candidatus Hamiltonella defensa]MBK4361320.1 RTX toxin [Candidatus Hamiltonella defensa]